MPAGDPAGYLPNVVKSRRRRGERAYQPKRKKLAPNVKVDPQTGGTVAPSSGRGFKPITPSASLDQRALENKRKQLVAKMKKRRADA